MVLAGAYKSINKSKAQQALWHLTNKKIKKLCRTEQESLSFFLFMLF